MVVAAINASEGVFYQPECWSRNNTWLQRGTPKMEVALILYKADSKYKDVRSNAAPYMQGWTNTLVLKCFWTN